MLNLGSLILSLVAAVPQAHVQDATSADALQARVTALVEQNEALPGLAVFVVVGREDEGGSSFGAAAGVAAPDGTPLTVDTPVRIASNTKTYTAAAFLRLWEQDRVGLEASLRALVDERFAAALESFGYDVDAITARHLLMHVGGLPDHADRDYVELVRETPTHAWTRMEQVELMGTLDGPVGAPGELFRYSDTGYVLLGHAIERATGQALGVAVRELLGLDRLGLATTWWELQEASPAGAADRAHQYLRGEDMHGVSATVDLYGGGGLVASPRDLAGFLAALLRGEVFAEDETLAVMTAAPGHPQPAAYRIGLFPSTIAGHDCFGHTGFWGTMAVYVPELDVAVAGVALDQAGFSYLARAIEETVADLASEDGER